MFYHEGEKNMKNRKHGCCKPEKKHFCDCTESRKSCRHGQYNGCTSECTSEYTSDCKIECGYNYDSKSHRCRHHRTCTPDCDY